MKLWTRNEYNKITKGKIYWKDNCPLCFNAIDIWNWKHWRLTTNIYPYSGNELHIMAFPKRHVKYTHDLNTNELTELKEVYTFAKDFFWNKEYFSFTRETMWSRSIEHLHMHFLPWQLKWRYLRKMLENQWFPIKENKL